MKFTAGYWEMRPEVMARFPVEVREVQTDQEGMTVHATTQRMTQRGDTLNQFPISMRFSSPVPNVIRVQIYHHKGRRVREPQFELYPQPGPLVIENGEQAATLTSGQLTARVAKEGPWSVEFRDGERVITSSGWRGAAFMETPEGRFAVEQLDLGVGECVYGLGEPKNWRVLLVGMGGPATIEGGSVESNTGGLVVSPAAGVKNINVQLDA
jgi:alpha-D-xyloside xylohydrolase